MRLTLATVALLSLTSGQLAAQQSQRYADAVQSIADSAVKLLAAARPARIVTEHKAPDTLFARRITLDIAKSTAAAEPLLKDFDAITPPAEFSRAHADLVHALAAYVGTVVKLGEASIECAKPKGRCLALKLDGDLTADAFSAPGDYREARNRVARMLRAAGARIRDLPDSVGWL